MSQLEVDKIIPQSGTTLTIGDSGDTISLPSGVSLTGVNATFSGDLTVDTDTLYVDSSSKYVQIGDGAARVSFLSNSNDSLQIKNGIIFESGDPAVNNEILTYRSNSLILGTGASERMRIDSSGNVGIGETSPLGRLHVKNGDTGGTASGTADELVLENSGPVGLSLLSPNNNAGSIFFADPDDNNVGEIQYNHSTNHLAFNVNAGEKMRIDSSGKVGIGTSSPSESLHIATTNGGKIRFGFSGFSIDSGLVSTGDMDNFKTSGFYRFDAAVSNTPSAHIYATVIFGNGSNVVTQIATRIANTITYVRSFNTSWTSWVRLD